MERKIKGIALMIFGLFLCALGVFLFLFTLRIIALVVGVIVAATMQLIGLYLVFVNKNKETDKIIQDFINGNEE